MKNVYMCYIGVTEGKIENLKKEGKMRISILIFIYTIHFAYLKVYTKFHNPKSSSCWENSDEKCPYVLYRSDRRKNWKRQNELKHPYFHLHNTLRLPEDRKQHLKTLAPVGAEKSVTKIFIGEKEKWTSKGTDMQYVTVFCYTIQVITIKLCIKFQNPKSSSCWEILDRKKCPFMHVFYRSDKEKLKIWKKANED